MFLPWIKTYLKREHRRTHRKSVSNQNAFQSGKEFTIAVCSKCLNNAKLQVEDAKTFTCHFSSVAKETDLSSICNHVISVHETLQLIELADFHDCYQFTHRFLVTRGKTIRPIKSEATSFLINIFLQTDGSSQRFLKNDCQLSCQSEFQ